MSRKYKFGDKAHLHFVTYGTLLAQECSLAFCAVAFLCRFAHAWYSLATFNQ